MALRPLGPPVREDPQPRSEDRPIGTPRWLALVLLSPALLMLAVLIVYPVLYSVVRSLFDDGGRGFVGLANYRLVFSDPHILTAIRNTAVWVTVGPTTVCALGLVFAVLAERVRWATAFRVVIFMPMAISLFASGVIFRLMYEEQPELGVANAVSVGLHDIVAEPAPYPGARPRYPSAVADTGDGLVTRAAYPVGEVVTIPLVGARRALPAQALPARRPAGAPAELRGLVWSDVSVYGRPGQTDPPESGMPLITVEALRHGGVVAVATTGDDGSFAFPALDPAGTYRLRLSPESFTPPFRGQTWLGAGLITPVIISCWVWITAGFSLVFVAAGLAAIPREVLEAARMDGATEAQVLRKVTIPLLAPVLLVVFVTLVITVLKVFDLVFVIAPGSAQDEATVLAVEIWRISFGPGAQHGLGSALCVVLFLLVTPAMLFNIRRFRKERS
jgi:alpha-glucoside transport system permease protein